VIVPRGKIKKRKKKVKKMESFFHTPFFLSFLSIAQSKRYGREEVSADCLVSFPWTGKSSLHQKQGKRRGVRGDVPNTFTL